MSDITKNLFFKDNIDIKDKMTIKSNTPFTQGRHYRPRTVVKLFYEEDGELKLQWTKHNMMTLAGGGFLARTLFNFDGAYTELTPTYNNALVLEDREDTESGQTSPIKVFGFCCGTDGCGLINSQVRAPKYASWINPDWNSEFGKVWGGIVPFQYRRSDDDLTAEQRDIYFGRKVLSDHFAYYFKTFDSDPILSQRYTNGDPIDSNVYTEDRGMDVETCVSMQMSVTKDDFRDFFYYGAGTNAAGEPLTINDARINSISLLMGWERVNSEGYKAYYSVRPLTLLYFSNESLIDLRKTIVIQYQLYF